MSNMQDQEIVVYVTPLTVTFPVPMSELASYLRANKGRFFTTYLDKKYILNNAMIGLILTNSQPSMFNAGKVFIYNSVLKGISEAEPNRFQLIREWAENRGLYDKGDMKTQYCKLGEESGELGRAIIKNDRPEVIDAIGDMVVVLTNVAALADKHFKELDPNSDDITIESCIDSAYGVISARTGKMQNGSFIKD